MDGSEQVGLDRLLFPCKYNWEDPSSLALTGFYSYVNMIGQTRAVWHGQASIPVIFIGQDTLMPMIFFLPCRSRPWNLARECSYNVLPVELSWDVRAVYSISCVRALRSFSTTVPVQPCARPYIGGIHVTVQAVLLGKIRAEMHPHPKQPNHPKNIIYQDKWEWMSK